MPWRNQARVDQLPPEGEWRTWYVRGGRGSGKTRSGAETLAEWIHQYPGNDWGVVAPKYGDVRDTCIEGRSGLLKALKLPRTYRGWNRSNGELMLPDGGTVFCDGADDGAERIQGKNLSGLWADEVGLWKMPRWRLAWDESINFAVRMAPGRIIATGTPKRGHPLVKLLMDDASVPKTLLRTLDNAANLDPGTLDYFIKRWGGTSLGAQELEGAILNIVEGALWTPDVIQVMQPPQRWAVDPGGKVLVDDLQRVVVAVDPAVTHGPDADETGIVVAGVRGDIGYLLDDLSGRYGPTGWARRVVALYQTHRADAVVAESNNGGEMVRLTIQTVDPSIPVKLVTASRGKYTRAEPVANLYQEGHVFHTRHFPELEDQLCTYTKTSSDSPDRLDAMVWAFTELMLGTTVPADFSMIA